MTVIITATGGSNNTSRLCARGTCGLEIYMGHETYVQSAPLSISVWYLQRIFSFCCSRFLTETDRHTRVTWSLKTRSFSISSTIFCVSVQVFGVRCKHQELSCAMLRPPASCCWRCVEISTLERGAVLSTFLSLARYRQEGSCPLTSLSTPDSLGE